VADGSRIRLRPLAERRDGDDWVIGRPETGDFIAVPDVAHRVLALLREGHAVDHVAARLRAETGKSFAVRSFVAALDDLGFVAAIDDDVRPDPVSPKPSLPWLRAAHVRWLLHPLTAAVAMAFVIVTAAALAWHHALMPSYRMLVWNGRPGLVIVVDAAIAWTLILLHEVAHLAAARATGAPARITISTRLQFLTAQTDVSGVWGAPRRHRMTVYLAGLGLDFVVVGTILLVLILAAPHGLARQLLCVAFAETLLVVPTQFMVFMRTDLYFVLQDLTRCANLYADGSAYLRYLARRVIRRGAGPDPDPSRNYPLPQRRAVRVYSAVLLAGTAVCLGVEFAVSFPALIALLARAIAEIGVTALGTLDGGVLLAVLVAWQVLWCARWWDRHRGQVRLLTRNLQEGGADTWRSFPRFRRMTSSRRKARACPSPSGNSTGWRRHSAAAPRARN
jgi:putative peptide zinc metalloprotease protein